MSTLICSACEKEIKFLREELLGREGERSSSKQEIILETLGVGFLDAALSLERLIQKHNDIEEIIFIGTAGTYSPTQAQIGELVNAQSAKFLSVGAVQGSSYAASESVFPVYDSNNIPVSDKDSLSQTVDLSRLENLQKAYCMSYGAITKDSKIAEKVFEDFGNKEVALVENMELYGVAKVASENNIVWTSILGITNLVSENSQAEWFANQEEVSRKLCDFLQGLLKPLPVS